VEEGRELLGVSHSSASPWTGTLVLGRVVCEKLLPSESNQRCTAEHKEEESWKGVGRAKSGKRKNDFITRAQLPAISSSGIQTLRSCLNIQYPVISKAFLIATEFPSFSKPLHLVVPREITPAPPRHSFAAACFLTGRATKRLLLLLQYRLFLRNFIFARGHKTLWEKEGGHVARHIINERPHIT
jgi:hypothetical protein